jgi:hypothetical protein
MASGETVEIVVRQSTPLDESTAVLLSRICDGMAATLEHHGVKAEKGPLRIPAGGGPGSSPDIWTIGAAAPIAAFFAAIASEVGKDAWRKLKDLIEDLRNPADGAGDVIQIWIKPEEGIILIPEGLPDEAYEELVRRVVSGEDANGLSWDPDAGEWRPR